MKMSTKGRYSTRAMIDLAVHSGQRPVQIKEIAARQEVSERYLEQLFILLKQAGLVKGFRGVHGGFTLAKPATKIRLIDIIEATERGVALAKCVHKPNRCSRSDVCLTRLIWAEIEKAISSALRSITLQDLVEQQTEGTKQTLKEFSEKECKSLQNSG